MTEPAPTLEVVEDQAAAPGNVLVPLARLLLVLVRREIDRRSEASEEKSAGGRS